jgi:HEAT repeat protein
MSKRFWFLAAAAPFAALFVIPTTRVVCQGLCRGEQVYRYKPTSYWALALTDRDESSAAGTVAVLKAGGARAVPVLVQALGDPDAQVRLKAADALGAVGRDAVPALGSALNEGPTPVRIAAARALARLGPEAAEALPALRSALSDGEPLVVAMAVAALGRTGRGAVPALVGVFQTNSAVQVRLAALEALGRLGPDAAAAVPVLVQAAKEEDDPVGEAAGEALKQIDPPAAEKAGII